MPATVEQQVAAQHAQRLKEDPAFQAIIENLRRVHTERAIYQMDAQTREVSRQIVIALAAVEGELDAAIEEVASMREQDALAHEMEDIV